MSSTKILTKTLPKKVFTRLTLDSNSLKAVRKVQRVIQNYDINDAVKMIFGLGMSQLDNILPTIDDNGFTDVTKQKLLKAKQELETDGGKVFTNPQEIIDYAQNLTQ